MKRKHRARKISGPTEKQPQELKQREIAGQEQSSEIRLTARGRIIRRVMTWSGMLLGLTLTVVGMIYLTNSPNAEDSADLNEDAVSTANWVKGNANASVILIEYGDYQCPPCARYHSIMERLTNEVGGDFQLIFRHYPLQRHANARLAAKSAEAAGQQGKFWEMHHLLFSRQREWSKKQSQEVEEIFTQYAASLNLDTARFQSDLHAQAIADKVSNDYQIGADSGVTGTPTFFLNGQRVTKKPGTYEKFRALILEAKTG